MKKVIVLLVSIICLAACKTKTVVVTVPEVHTDTIQITKHQRDSIWLHDSIHVTEKQKGDTVWLQLEKWHTKYVEKDVHDTIYQSKVDSVPVPYPYPEYIDKPLTWWQKFRINVGSIALLILLVWGVWQAAKIYLKRF